MNWYMEIDEKFRRNLIRLREESGIDAKSLSKLAGLGERGVKDIEEGRSQSPKISTAFKLAKALNVSMPEIMGLTDGAVLIPELVDFLAQYDADGQSQLLSALAAIHRPIG
jgi:transcriptional regulator with XRE-family HTH domain